MVFYKLKSLITIIALMVFIAGLQISGGFLYIPNAQGAGNVSMDIKSTIEINELGILESNYNLLVKNSGQTSETINKGIVLYLPLSYQNKIDAYRMNSSLDVELSISKNFKNTVLKIDNNNGIILSPDKEEYVNIELRIRDALNATERDGLYFATIPMLTTSNIDINRLDLTLRVPDSAPFYNISDYSPAKSEGGFGRETQSYIEIAKTTFSNITKNDYLEERLYVLTNPGIEAFSIVEIDSFTREVYISDRGDIMIRETIEITNLDSGRALRKIRLDLIGPERDELNVPRIRNITTVPDREPPIAAKGVLTLENPPINRIEIERLVRHTLEAGNSLVIKYEYKLDKEFIETDTNSIIVNIPTTPTLKTTTDNYRIVIVESDSYSISSNSPLEVNLDKNEQLMNNNITISYVPGIAWASTTSVPIGSIIFFIALLGMMIRVERKEDVEIEGGGEEEIVVKTRELTGLYGEKISLLKNILERMEKWDKETISKNQIENVKNEINTIRTRNAGQLAIIRKDIIELKSSQKEVFEELNKSEQSLERDIFQTIQLYEQYRLNRINKQEMEKRLSEYKKNVFGKINNIIATLQVNSDSLEKK